MLQNYSTVWSQLDKGLPSIIDLFSGCGGLGFGFQAAGFPIGGGMDISESAVKTASFNMDWRHGEAAHHVFGDITQTPGAIFKENIGNEGCVVIGGPPCQAYSQIGKGKLKSLGTSREHINDSRGQLYLEFLRMAFELNAKAIIMENVPESINYGGLNIPEEACSILEKNGYTPRWTILNSADYGVPQVRERLFIIAVEKKIKIIPEFPLPTHRSMEGKIAPYKLRAPKLLRNKYYVPAPEVLEEAFPWVTVGEALSDLPSLFPDSTSKYRLFEQNMLIDYSKPPSNDYQILMRGWYGSSIGKVSGHGFRRTIRDYPIFEKMQQEDNFVIAAEIAEQLFKEACDVEGISKQTHPQKYQLLRKKIVPPYDKWKFQDKWKRLNSKKPSHTLVAHLSVDTYSHIHPWEPRGISVREAARLQSFPDQFLFQCSMGDAFKQIGNAVPPLLSYALAKQIKKCFI